MNRRQISTSDKCKCDASEFTVIGSELFSQRSGDICTSGSLGPEAGFFAAGPDIHWLISSKYELCFVLGTHESLRLYCMSPSI